MNTILNGKFHEHPWSLGALKKTEHKVFWTDNTDGLPPEPNLKGQTEADLVIIGGGYTGLWAALQASEENPGRNITLLEAHSIGYGASSRNGGFCDMSITHGLFNGITHWPKEYRQLHRLGKENLVGMLNTLDRYAIDATVEQTGVLYFALEDWHVENLHELGDTIREYGDQATFLDTDEARKRVNSPTYIAGLKIKNDNLQLNPAQLVWGLHRACKQNGVHIFEQSKVEHIESKSNHLLLKTANGQVKTSKAIMATNAWGEPEKSVRKYLAVIHDHVLVTEPLSQIQMESIGWKGREGLADEWNLFHYYRLTKDNRILWGGFDPHYHKAKEFVAENENYSFSKLAAHFFHTFPQLEGLKFTHKWSGPISTSSKFAATYGTKYGGKLAWVGGYTGLGVGTSRFASRVALDLVDGKKTERTALEMVRKKPFPFPPFPFRHPIVQYTRQQIANSDNNQGKRGLWLRFLDSIGIGFEA